MNELPTAWSHESTLLSINGLEVKYTGPDDYKVAARVLTNDPIPSQCKYFYFEVEIIDGGSNGMIGIGFCTKSTDQTKQIEDLNIMAMPGQEKDSWGYHGDDGYFYCSGSGEPYGSVKNSGYTAGDTIGCYLNFESKIVFYTKNGINLGIACYLPDGLEGILFPCVGFRSQEGSIKANFGNDVFKYSALDNNYISNETPDLMNEVTNTLETNQSNADDLCYRGKTNFIMGRYEEALGDLTELLKIEPDNIIALRYRGENNYLMKKYKESIADLENLLKIKPDDTWAKEALKLAKEL